MIFRMKLANYMKIIPDSFVGGGDLDLDGVAYGAESGNISLLILESSDLPL